MVLNSPRKTEIRREHLDGTKSGLYGRARSYQLALGQAEGEQGEWRGRAEWPVRSGRAGMRVFPHIS
jgi:hypothetical protein